MKVRLLILILTVFLQTLSGADTAIIQGTVVTGTQRALADIRIILQCSRDLNHITFTSDNGHFQFNNLPAGVYQIICFDQRYKTANLKKLKLNPGIKVNLTVILGKNKSRIHARVNSKSHRPGTDTTPRHELLNSLPTTRNTWSPGDPTPNNLPE